MSPSDPSGSPDTDSTDTPRSFTDALLDALVYAPIGLTLDGQELAPDLARRGRQHAKNARLIGEMAVKGGLQRIDGRLADRIRGDEDDQPTQPAANPAPEPQAPEAAEETTGEDDDTEPPTADHLAIPDYDLLAASQVVKRLDGLDEDQLEAVRVYEAATRDRRTILHKIARLQS